MRLICRTLLIIFFSSLPSLVLAVAINDLYSATVEVPDQNRKHRQQGFSLALAQVLIKTTGAKDIAAQPGVSDALSQASNYMVKYAYLPRPAIVEPIESDGVPIEQNTPLSVQFAKAAIDDLMRKLDLPIWPANRPELLIWVVEQTASGYRFVDEADLPPELASTFKSRGQPFQLPLYDLNDQLALNALAAWSLNEQQLGDAAKRYGADSWLVLRYSEVSSGAVRGSWYLAGRSGKLAGEGTVLNTLQADSESAFLSRSIDQVVDRLAEQMAYFADAEANLFRVVVENINSFAAFSELNHFLSGLEIVNGVKVRSIEGDTIILDLAMEGESRVLLRALNKESRLSRVTQLDNDSTTELTSVAGPRTNTAAYFRWQAAR